MKSVFANYKGKRNRQNKEASRSSAGIDGASMTPPAYGMGVLDGVRPIQRQIEEQHWHSQHTGTYGQPYYASTTWSHPHSAHVIVGHLQPQTPLASAAQVGTPKPRRRDIVMGGLRAAGHSALGAAAVIAGSGLTSTGFGAPVGILGIIYGVLEEMKAVAIATSAAIRAYARWWQGRGLSDLQANIVRVCEKVESGLGKITSALNISGWINLLVEAIASLLKVVGWLLDPVSRLASGSVGQVLHKLGSALQSVGRWISRINELRQHPSDPKQWDEIAAYVQTATAALHSSVTEFRRAGDKAAPT